MPDKDLDIEIITTMSHEERMLLLSERNAGTGYISASSIATYLACPYKWYLSKIEKIETPTGLPLIQGSALHNFFESLFDGTIKEIEDVTKSVEQTFENELKGKQLAIWGDVPEDVQIQASMEKIIEMISYWLKHSDKVEAAKMQPPRFDADRKKFVETYFCIPIYIGDDLTKWNLHGFIDMFSQDSYIYDWKSAADRRKWPFSRENHEIQSFVYYYAMLKAKLEPIGLRYVLFFKHKNIAKNSFEVREAKIEPMNARHFVEVTVVQILKDITMSLDGKRDWIPTPSDSGCRYCDFRARCPQVPDLG